MEIMSPYNVVKYVSLPHEGNHHEERIELLEIGSEKWIRLSYWTERTRKDGSTYLNISPRSIMLTRSQLRKLLSRALEKRVLKKEDFPN